MDIHGNINLRENTLQAANLQLETNFPSNPQPGRMLFKDGTFYFCVAIEDTLPVWVPCGQVQTMQKVTKATPALEWTITHTLNCSTCLVQIFDADNLVIFPHNIDCSVFNQVLVTFNTPVAGTAILIRGNETGPAQPSIAYEQGFIDQSTIVVAHGLGYNPIVRVIVGGKEVQPQSITMNSVNQLTIAFSSARSGTVRCI